MSLTGVSSFVLRVTARRARTVAPFLLTLALLGGCKINAVPPPTGCVRDNQCDPGALCTAGTCVPRAAGGTWAIELLPTSDSPGAQTQLTAVNFSNDRQNILTADAKATITGDLPEGEALIGHAHVILTIQTPIPGHADLQFQTDWLTPKSGPPLPFSLTLPASTLGSNATFLLSALPPADDAQPPENIQIKLSTANHLMVDHTSFYVTARIMNPSGTFVAHALSGGQVVSNNAKVQSDGMFRVAIPKQVVQAAAAPSGQPITIEVVPSGSQYSTPRFTTPPITFGSNMEMDIGTLNVPAIGFAALFRFKVAGPDQKPVSGAIVRAHTVLASDESGSSELVRDGTTDTNGNVDLPLLPSLNGGTQNYDVSVIPPAGSAFGISCVSGVAINAAQNPGGAGSTPVAAQLSLPNKATLSGTIVNAAGSAVAGVAIAATRTAADPTSNCASSIIGSSASGITLADGSFQIMVDPGTYRLDFDPPAGAAVPRLTQTDVVVTAGSSAMGSIGLPAGELVNGEVHASDGSLLPSVDVRFFRLACSGADQCYGTMRVPPILSAETHSDANGAFQAVVPVQP
jgi:hypothetical protein